MSDLRDDLRGELVKLKKIEKQITRDLSNAPEGALEIWTNKNTKQFYHRIDNNKKHSQYISKKKNMQLVRALAQKDYASKLFRILSEEKIALEKYLSLIEDSKMEQTYQELTPMRRSLTNAYIETEEQFIQKWEAKNEQVKLEHKERYPAIDSEIFTEKGEQVRSKSEKILADKFYMMGIPYAYEVPLYLEGYGYVRPDFKVLNIRKRKEYIWEHFGMMDDQKYCENTLRKIDTYTKNSLLLGEHLLISYETSEHPLNMKVVQINITQYLL